MMREEKEKGKGKGKGKGKEKGKEKEKEKEKGKEKEKEKEKEKGGDKRVAKEVSEMRRGQGDETKEFGTKTIKGGFTNGGTNDETAEGMRDETETRKTEKLCCIGRDLRGQKFSLLLDTLEGRIAD